MTDKELFISILKDNCKDRMNVEQVIEYLENSTDFFDAPASSKYHLNCRGGLLKHSLNVYHTLSNLCELYYEEVNKASLTIVALFHDLCKVNFYKLSTRNIKTPLGWTQEPYYIVDDQLPLGHGEKSVIMLQRLFSLTEEEILAIRWHMNGFDSAVKGGDYALATAANGKYNKLITLTQCADMISAQILEN